MIDMTGNENIDDFAPPITTGMERVDVEPFVLSEEDIARLDEFQRVRDMGIAEAQTAYLHGIAGRYVR